MGSSMENTPEYYGSLVAFEGPEETVLTQLRLLPSSSKVLIIPSLRYFLPSDTDDSSFDPRSYILKVHEACNARAQVARSYLQYGTPDNKRLAFMHGGTASARLDCIDVISAHSANGDIAEAEKIFNKLVQNGVGGLRSQGKDMKSPVLEEPHIAGVVQGDFDDDMMDDPISRAMKAAEALDRKTASLQTYNEIDLTVKPRPRSTSVPALRTIDDFRWNTPFYTFGGPGYWRNLANQGMKENQIENQRASMALDSPPSGPMFPSSTREGYSRPPLSPLGLNLDSPGSPTFSSAPNTPTVIGEAHVIDVRWSPERTDGVGCPYISACHNRTMSLSTTALPGSKDTGNQYNRTIHATYPRDSLQEVKHARQSRSFSEIRRPAFSEPSRATARRCPPPPLKLDCKPLRRPRSYVSQSTNSRPKYISPRASTDGILPCQDGHIESDGLSHNLEEDVDPGNYEPFEIVLPMVEDFVLHLKDDEDPHSRLDDIIKRFRDGTIQMPTPPSSRELERSQASGEPTSTSAHKNNAMTHPEARKAGVPLSQPDPGEYDPFAFHGDYLEPKSRSATRSISGRSQTVVGSSPPTPAQTPPPADRPPKKTFHKLNITDFKTAICVQDSLRSILKVYFSPENIGYQQFKSPLLPELGSFWEPVFCKPEPSNPKQATRKPDLILAIGAQGGVDQSLLGTITTSLEKLGARPNGTTHSARVDLRYLIATAWQTFAARPLAEEVKDDPLSDPDLLATLLIPHLETYLSTHTRARLLLLEYPASHLATVLALQRLLGGDLVKVVGVLGPASRRAAHAHRGPSFSGANYLLGSRATPADIAALIADVWRVLLDISAQYGPPDGGILPAGPIADAAGMLGFRPPVPEPPRLHRDGVAVRSAGSRGRGGGPSRASKLLRVLGGADEQSSVYLNNIMDADEEEDNCDGEGKGLGRNRSGRECSNRLVDEDERQLAADERRYMPLWGLQQKASETKRGNTRKALKWLGLSN
ncbi:hypothetical protein F4810DRAFT_725410 [Camillea tinctor]|nr:hypothetical protein F4810DRAFT_725410 [Camillea tinctor]